MVTCLALMDLKNIVPDYRILFLTFQLVIQVLQNDPDHLDQRQDQRAESQRASVVPEKWGEVDLDPVG